MYRRRDVEALVEAHAVSGFLKASETEPEVSVDSFERALQTARQRKRGG
jgi:hypothetical protein